MREPCRLREGDAAWDERRDRQNPFQSASTLSSRPGRTRAARARQQFFAQGAHVVIVVAAEIDGLEAIGNVVAFEVAGLGDVVARGEIGGVL